MAVTIQVRRDTASNWSSNNPTLESGEVGFETDENKIKLGDGSTAWNSLSYINPSSPTFTDITVSGSFNDHVNLISGKEFRINGTAVLSSSSLGSGITSSSLTSVGTISSGVWQATDIDLSHGGTNASLTAVEGGIVYSTSSAMAITSAGSSGQVLTSNGTSAPTWQEVDLGFNAFLLAGM